MKSLDDLRPKLFVLDTNVLMHNPAAIFNFEEHDIFLPQVVLEELDAGKKGMTEIAANVRMVTRWIEEMRDGARGDALSRGIAIRLPISNGIGTACPRGKLRFQTKSWPKVTEVSLNLSNDRKIIACARDLQEQHPEFQIILVSKDINCRIQAATYDLVSEDYANDKVMDDVADLYTGMLKLPDGNWAREQLNVESWRDKSNVFYRITGPEVVMWYPYQCLYNDDVELIVIHKETPNCAVLRLATDFQCGGNFVWGLKARNREQNFALNLLLDPNVDLITFEGVAGTGKTLLTIAAGLELVMESKKYLEIIMTRETVPVGEDIGFLPGTEEEKMAPWMGALIDNLELLGSKSSERQSDFEHQTASTVLMSRVKIRSLNFMRGRTFLQRFMIIDEAQNLTSKQMKTLITRAGPNTKVVVIGNISQIDTPYLSANTSGLTHTIDRFKTWEYSGHICLRRGERSRLADAGTELL